MKKFNFYFISLILLLSANCSNDDDGGDDAQNIVGCTSVSACNYDPNANQDDGTCYFCNDCTSNTVESSESKGTVNLNVFDYNSSSQYYNQVVMLFTVEWIQDLYCQDIDNKFYIRFKNVTNNTITFDYITTSNADGNIRSTQGFIQNLAPNDTHEVLTPPNSFWNINLYPVTVSGNSIQYN